MKRPSSLFLLAGLIAVCVANARSVRCQCNDAVRQAMTTEGFSKAQIQRVCDAADAQATGRAPKRNTTERPAGRGSEFLGRWIETGDLAHSGSPCRIGITKLNNSFVVTPEPSPDSYDCKGYESIRTLTPEGNLTEGGRGLIIFDKDKSELVVSGLSERVRHLIRMK